MGAPIYLKYENEQRTGSFKIRGALAKIMSLSDSAKKIGVIASSAGNHAQGVALASSRLKVPSVVVMPESSPIVKVNASRGYGAEVVLHGKIYDEAFEHAQLLSRDRGMTFVHPFEDQQVIAGQGSVGLEILEQSAQYAPPDTIVIPVGGGGLISGVATAIKHHLPNCKIYGVQAQAAPGMVELFLKKLPPPAIRGHSIADGILVKYPSRLMYEEFIHPLVDDMITVTDDEIAAALVFLLERVKTVVEGSAAAAFAAIMFGKVPLGRHNCVLLSGGNIDLNIISRVIERGLLNAGRLARISVVVEDVPGKLSEITRKMGECQINVLEVYHKRTTAGLSLRETEIDFLLEFRAPEDLQRISKYVAELGGKVIRSSLNTGQK